MRVNPCPVEGELHVSPSGWTLQDRLPARSTWPYGRMPTRAPSGRVATWPGSTQPSPAVKSIPPLLVIPSWWLQPNPPWPVSAKKLT